MMLAGEPDDLLDVVTTAQEALGKAEVHRSDYEQELEEMYMELDRIAAELMEEDQDD